MDGWVDGQNNVQGYYKQYFQYISCHVFVIVLLFCHISCLFCRDSHGSQLVQCFGPEMF